MVSKITRQRARQAREDAFKPKAKPSPGVKRKGSKNLKFYMVHVIAFLPNTIWRWLGW